jgi:hypothetical protein
MAFGDSNTVDPLYEEREKIGPVMLLLLLLLVAKLV